MVEDVEDDGLGCASKRRRTIGRCGLDKCKDVRPNVCLDSKSALNSLTRLWRSDATLLDGQAPKAQLETRLATALLCEQHKTSIRLDSTLLFYFWLSLRSTLLPG